MTTIAPERFTITAETETAEITRCQAILDRACAYGERPGYMPVITMMAFLRAALTHYRSIPPTPDRAEDRSLAVLCAEVEAEQLIRVIRLAYAGEADYVAGGDE